MKLNIFDPLKRFIETLAHGSEVTMQPARVTTQSPNKAARRKKTIAHLNARFRR
jgi:hypothetical protein